MNTAASVDEVASDALPSMKEPLNPIPHWEVVDRLLQLFDSPSYLEIGVNRGQTFNFVKAAKKVAVDPKLRFDYESVAAAVPGASCHNVKSDDYFGKIATRETAFDVIFLDGLHTSEQTTRDLLNSISFLKPNGVIIIDDVFPSSYEASLADHAATRDMRGTPKGDWMGDVYRLVFFIESFCQQFSYSTVNNNYGMLVMWREPRRKFPKRTLREVAEKEYKDLFLERESLRCAPLETILARIQAARC